ncbi:VOC family protein [Rhizobium sp. SSA_523]|uniref:VOC family protein n=1 Tax=Rhizobium sp. SSA_523 TaxID=2952477 RepID=UPI0020912BAF|nr:VOC family protein [Rhizobium sp. SSA_523]MCO5733419.1 VOC family protein [Rhizobium sp. SSA_523]WKC21608.1 VOC family protein [Rhizobium sp. SSA_523]
MSLYLPIDHIVVLVQDLGAAGHAFEAAGFHVTPETRHSAAMGTANRCVMLQGSYIEIMGIVAETAANATWCALLSEGSGIRGFALRSSDIDASAQELASLDIPAEPVRHFSRMTDDGELRFSITRIDPVRTPGLQCLLCQHHTAELLWRPDTMKHINGASSLVSVTLPQARSLSGFPTGNGEGTEVKPGGARLLLSGARAMYSDLRDVCGLEVEVVAA